MKSIVFLLMGCVMLFACDDNKSLSLAGDYSGTFYRTRDNVKTLESEVMVSFNSGDFSGSGTDNQSPAICRGTYSVNGNEIDFVNGCFFTANFDWTLILSGKFTISETDESILLSKEINSQNGDYYLFRKTLNAQ